MNAVSLPFATGALMLGLVTTSFAADGTTGPAKIPADQPMPRTDENSKIAHRQLLEKAKQGTIDVYFVGDSITRRWGALEYPKLVEHWNKTFHGWNPANFAWGGDNTRNILWRLDNGELEGVQPKVYVIMAGTNNLGERMSDDEKVTDITKGVQAIVERCRKHSPDAEIILTAMFPRNDRMTYIPVINRINGNLAKYAKENSIHFLTLNGKLADADGVLHEGMTVDRLHLDEQGYDVWAGALVPVLTEILGPRAKTDNAPPLTGNPAAGF
jgi:lysophospholipase L1-like esterase